MKRIGFVALMVCAAGLIAIGSHAQTLTPEPFCPNAPPTRLIVYQRARVATTDPRPVNVRSDAGTQNDRIAQIPSNEIFFVLDGPVCTERYAWYRIDFDGVVGWIAEGDNISYYVELYPPGM